MKRLFAVSRIVLLLVFMPAISANPIFAQNGKQAGSGAAPTASRSENEDQAAILKADLDKARALFGADDDRVILKIDELAVVLDRQGSLEQAEDLFRESMGLKEKRDGERGHGVLGSKERLAANLRKQGKYVEAERLLKEALQGRRAVQGPDNLDTLKTMNALSGLMRVGGRYGEAERLITQELEVRRRIEGDKHADTLTAINNLASIYFDQGATARPSLSCARILRARTDTLGAKDAATLRSMNNLASDLRLQKRNDLAEPLLRETLLLRKEVLGPDHADTLSSMNNLALLLRDQKKFDELEGLLRQVLDTRRKSLGPDHPDTLLIMDNLSVLLRIKGKYDAAEELLAEARERSARKLGEENPSTRSIYTNSVLNFVAAKQFEKAASLEKQMEQSLLSWLGAELYNTEATSARRTLVDSQANFQDVALTFALLACGNDEAVRNAASIVLHFKGLSLEENAYLSHLAREGADPRVSALARDIAALHKRLSRAVRAGETREDMKALALQLDRKELELGEISREFTRALQSRAVRLEDVQAKLKPEDCLLEIRQYRPVDFVSGDAGDPRWAGILIEQSGRNSHQGSRSGSEFGGVGGHVERQEARRRQTELGR